MEIKKAIEILEEFRIPDPGEDWQDIDNAIKLGIEALKRQEARRKLYSNTYYQPLPGETEESSEEAQEIDPGSTKP